MSEVQAYKTAVEALIAADPTEAMTVITGTFIGGVIAVTEAAGHPLDGVVVTSLGYEIVLRKVEAETAEQQSEEQPQEEQVAGSDL